MRDAECIPKASSDEGATRADPEVQAALFSHSLPVMWSLQENRQCDLRISLHSPSFVLKEADFGDKDVSICAGKFSSPWLWFPIMTSLIYTTVHEATGGPLSQE